LIYLEDLVHVEPGYKNMRQFDSLYRLKDTYQSSGLLRYPAREAAQLRITARMCIGASEGASGSSALRRASSPHRPLALVRLGAASHTSDTLYAIAPTR